ncbi:carbohydrate ABC transporter permease [Paenibacillus qinlingensis]|uniref:Aldouronate transport system permease protein n=1 Tax=Paenibacillus qinlingensis TaxID=1837343 RepID=A0ABU1P0D4_9BACL|nr:carbohydrate ABC transporter permease [Paenibacillus qinlingensis]MDR6553212.1 putative aldouronate transport system permease protein [Paenibacillus qinlingensis]
MIHERSWGSRLFDVINYTILILFALSTLLPFVHIVSSSFASPTEKLTKDFVLFPTQFTLDAYRFIFSTDRILNSLLVTILITVGGTIVNLIMTCLMAYPLSRRDLIGRRPIMMMVIFTLLFSGGMIPTFLIVKALGLLDSLWALIIPSAISTFNLIILKNFFQQMPDGIEESAKIDGANDLSILVRIILPLSLPALATFGLFYAVGHWNTFMSAILYIRDTDKWPIQVLLRSFVLLSEGRLDDAANIDGDIQLPPETVKMAVITVATLPILCVYPFLQKHFAKGVMMGSIKG